MFIQKITITHNIKNSSNYKLYLEERDQDKIQLDLESDEIVVYRTYDIWNENVLKLILKNLKDNCKNHNCKCDCNLDIIRFSLGDKYKGEIQLRVEETDVDYGMGYKLEYNIYVDEEYANI